MNPQDPKRGDLFPHARYITADRKPEVCRVTRVTADSVWYRVGGGEGPATHHSSRARFPEKVWRESQDPRLACVIRSVV